jgi:hypothetical protein
MEVCILTLLLALLSSCAALPAKYDQRQEGDLNVQAHLENFIIVLIPNNGALSLLDYIPLKKDANKHGSKVPAAETDKYTPPSTATKSTSPDFPAGTSPYKVDLDKKPDGSPQLFGGEVLITQSAPVTLLKTSARTDSPSTSAPSDDETSVKPAEELATETTKKEDTSLSSSKTETPLDEVDSAAAEKEETENKDKIDTEKRDEVPLKDPGPKKQDKSSKNIEFVAKVPVSSQSKPSEEDIPVIDFSPSSVKSSKLPAFRLKSENPYTEEPANNLKTLRTGVEEPCRDRLGNCRRTKSRYDNLTTLKHDRIQVVGTASLCCSNVNIYT